MGDESRLKESNVDIKPSQTIIKILDEHHEKVPENKNDILESALPTTLPTEKVVGAATDNQPIYGYPGGNQGYGQTPYYQQQQQVGGQRVYVQGQQEPANAARMDRYRPRNENNNNDIPRDGVPMFGDSFNSVKIRNRFIQRVYTILAIQLIYTCGFIALCIFEPSVKDFVLTNIIILLIAFGIEMVVYFSLVCCISARRNFPLNFILLAVFTVSFAYIMGAISTKYSTQIVLTSIGITAAVCLIISIIACQAWFDITGCGMYLCIFGLVVAVFGLIAILVAIFTGSRIMFIIYAGLIALVFSLYLMYDTQMIMGGQRIEMSPEEYIFGALCLYVDIMEIFWAILTIFGLKPEDACC